MQEVWKDIKGYEGLYQVSNHGNVKSKDRFKRNNGGLVLLKSKIMKQKPNSRGYMRVMLTNEKEKRCFFVHRLVALHFVENQNPKINTVVNHIDCNHLNNHSDNLEWTTQKGNVQHALAKGRMVRTKEWILHLKQSKANLRTPVIGENIKSKEKVYFDTLNDCKREGFQPSCVCNCCKGIRNTHKGYVWKYAAHQ